MTAAQLLSLGASGKFVGHRVAAGWLTPVHRGVYRVGPGRLDRDGRDTAAVLACGRDADLSHRSAGAGWGLMRWEGAVEVTAPTHRRSRAGIIVHQAVLAPADRRRRDNLPITSVPRTLLDLAGVLSPDALERAVHEAEVRRLLEVEAVLDALDRAGRRRGTTTLRRLLAQHQPLSTGRLRSPLEVRFALYHRARHLPPAQTNVLYALDDGEIIELDVVWPEAALAVEADGRSTHDTVKAFHADRRRDRRLQAIHGVLVIRVTHRDLDERPDELEADLRTLYIRRHNVPPGAR